jgi:predicted RNase H-like nuclease (RuvC/YqgF family)
MMSSTKDISETPPDAAAAAEYNQTILSLETSLKKLTVGIENIRTEDSKTHTQATSLEAHADQSQQLKQVMELQATVAKLKNELPHLKAQVKHF